MKTFSKIIIVSAAMLAFLSCSKDNPESGDGTTEIAPNLVDLGLSVKWGTFNLGASKPEEYGGYYQWAGSQNGKDRHLDMTNCPYHSGMDHEINWTKYITFEYASMWSGPGRPDNKLLLDPEDDAAHVKLGGSWRIATEKEWQELVDNCTWTWTKLNGVDGYMVTSKKAGFTDKSIFFPAAGYRKESEMRQTGTFGIYWSSVLYTNYPANARVLFFDSKSIDKYDYKGRHTGLPIRPVSK